MKKSILAIPWVLASAAVVAGSVTEVNPAVLKHGKIISGWTSRNPSDKILISNPTKVYMEVNIVVNQSNTSVPLDGIYVVCNGASYHVNPGAGLKCGTMGDVSWSDDGSGAPYGSSGEYEF